MCKAALFLVVLLAVSALPMEAQTLTVLHSFSSGTDGAYPVAGLVRDKQRNLYGTTVGVNGNGTVFKLDTTGNVTVLYSFTDGAYPVAGLVRDKQGNLYGTTFGGGSSNYGTVFKLDMTGEETVLHSFTGPPDGVNPFAGLVRDKVGNLYGTTVKGGSSNYGCSKAREPRGTQGCTEGIERSYWGRRSRVLLLHSDFCILTSAF